MSEDLAEITDGPPTACATLWHTLEHLPDPVGTLRRLAPMLEPGGAVLVAVPDWGGLQARTCGRHWLHLDVPRHLYHFTAKSLGHCLRRAGFAIERLWHQEFEYDLLGWSQSVSNGLMGPQNAFFDLMAGKGSELPPGTKVQVLALGSVLSALALPLVAAGALLGRGGSLIAAARAVPGLLSAGEAGSDDDYNAQR